MIQNIAIMESRDSKKINVRNQLYKLSRLLEPHQYNERNDLLDEMISACSDGKDNDSEKMLGYLMAGNLSRRFSGSGITENLYESVAGVSQIRLFDILIHQFPFVKHSQEMTNNAIVDIMRKHEEVCIVDIGIGLGTQILHILEKAKELTNLRKVTVVGIEPFENALSVAEEKINACKEDLAFELQFVSVPEYIETVSLTKYCPANTVTIVNASLALHHIGTEVERNNVIATIKSIQPEAFFLIEPNVNHFTNDLAARMLNSYEHFISIFQVIDRLDASNEDKNALKLFFGRELEDILSKSDDKERFEKHEPVSAWLQRLHKNGFKTNTQALLTSPEEILGVKILPFPKGYVGFVEKSETVLSVIAAS
ncbi:MAG: hypothetical protein KDC11_05425 [Chitinophagaceae bacterium]|nr:hypothetical protein [Chitinophagaceae bacterium]